MLDANLILTIGLYSVIVTVNTVGFYVTFCSHFLLLNKIVLCGSGPVVQLVEALWPSGGRETKSVGSRSRQETQKGWGRYCQVRGLSRRWLRSYSLYQQPMSWLHPRKIQVGKKGPFLQESWCRWRRYRGKAQRVGC